MRIRILLVLILSGCVLPEIQSSDWTVMSWNAQNLFDDEDNGTEYAEFDPGTGNWNTRLFERRLDRTAEVIIKTVPGGADLLVLQELENRNVLQALLKGPLGGKGYNYSLSIPGYSIIRCGILSRYPVSHVHVVDSGEWKNRSLRPVLGFTVATPESNVRVYALHWKSPRGDREATEEARILEAEILRSLINKQLALNPDSKILAIGDLNTPADGLIIPAALAPFENHGKAPASAVLWQTSNPQFQPSNNAIVLFDPVPESGPPGTYYYKGQWDRPDRALLSSGLAAGAGIQFESAHIGNMDILFDKYGHPARWQTDQEEGYSDHLPLVLKFKVVSAD